MENEWQARAAMGKSATASSPQENMTTSTGKPRLAIPSKRTRKRKGCDTTAGKPALKKKKRKGIKKPSIPGPYHRKALGECTR